MLESIYISWYDCGQHFGHPADFTGANDIMFPVTPCPGLCMLNELSHKSHLSGSVSSMSSTLHQIPVIQCRVHWCYWKSSRETFGWLEKSPTGAASSPLEYMSSREMKPESFNILMSGRPE